MHYDLIGFDLCTEYFFKYFLYSLVLPQQHKLTTIFLDQRVSTGVWKEIHSLR